MAWDKVYVAAVGVSFLGAVFLCISLSTPYWIQNQGRSSSGGSSSLADKFDHGGLWTMCFRNWDPSQDPIQKYYDGCYYVFEKEVDPIRYWIAPGWFVGVQVIVSLSTFVLLLAALVQFLHFMRFFDYGFAVRVGSAILSFILAIILCIAVILYGVRSSDQLWMPDSERNYLSVSFVFAVVTTFLCVISAMLFVVTSLTNRYQNRDTEEFEQGYKMNGRY